MFFKEKNPREEFRKALLTSRCFLENADLDVDKYLERLRSEDILTILSDLLNELDEKGAFLPVGYLANFGAVGKIVTGDKNFLDNFYKK